MVCFFIGLVMSFGLLSVEEAQRESLYFRRKGILSEYAGLSVNVFLECDEAPDDDFEKFCNQSEDELERKRHYRTFIENLSHKLLHDDYMHIGDTQYFAKIFIDSYHKRNYLGQELNFYGCEKLCTVNLMNKFQYLLLMRSRESSNEKRMSYKERIKEFESIEKSYSRILNEKYCRDRDLRFEAELNKQSK